MLKPTRLFLVTLGILVFNVCSLAQANWSRDRGFHNWYFGGGYSSYGGFGGYGYGRGSTVEGDWLRGVGAYYDSLGRLHVNNAIAARHFQAAYTLYLKNQKLRVQTYYEVKDIRDEYLAKKRAAEIAARAGSGVPARLTAKQRDASTGALAWPRGLTMSEFADGRAIIERLFTERAEKPDQAGELSNNQKDIQAAIEDMQADLGELVGKMSAVDFAAAYKFLKTLSNEARFKPKS